MPKNIAIIATLLHSFLQEAKKEMNIDAKGTLTGEGLIVIEDVGRPYVYEIAQSEGVAVRMHETAGASCKIEIPGTDFNIIIVENKRPEQSDFVPNFMNLIEILQRKGNSIKKSEGGAPDEVILQQHQAHEEGGVKTES